MRKILGLDIGGANTKATLLEESNGLITKTVLKSDYFPFWKKTKDEFSGLLVNYYKILSDSFLTGVGVTMTAELSDVYTSKQQGINTILDAVQRVFKDIPVWVLSSDGYIIPVNEVRNPLKIASANWVATGFLVAQYLEDCIVVDVGSTSTSIIPIANGKVIAEGLTDLDKLINGELVYTGSLRTNVSAIVKSMPIKGKIARVSSEFFAQSADVHLILGNISKEDYTVETPDGKEKTKNMAKARLSRVVCADSNMLTKQEIFQMAQHVYNQQITEISEGINQVKKSKYQINQDIPIVVTGFGKEFLAKKSAQKINSHSIIDIDEIIPEAISLATPATGVAVMTANEIEGKRVKWMQQ
ncbi:MAG: hydantoinase/oxoprolinase family protein [Ignavibacteriaceae bacterium]